MNGTAQKRYPASWPCNAHQMNGKDKALKGCQHGLVISIPEGIHTHATLSIHTRPCVLVSLHHAPYYSECGYCMHKKNNRKLSSCPSLPAMQPQLPRVCCVKQETRKQHKQQDTNSERTTCAGNPDDKPNDNVVFCCCVMFRTLCNSTAQGRQPASLCTLHAIQKWMGFLCQILNAIQNRMGLFCPTLYTIQNWMGFFCRTLYAIQNWMDFFCCTLYATQHCMGFFFRTLYATQAG
eukprot:1150577-Pelagomonas_calceolata.AAC.9